ncbi:hypothetical protein JCM19233_4369 [Vibrio astriarenae]|nr:hypothetical protein JCM19233_4369 [Vibrio sp. C7]
MIEAIHHMFNMRKCLAWLIVIDYIIIGAYTYLMLNLVYLDLILVGSLIVIYNMLIVYIIVHLPLGSLSMINDKHLVIPICLGVFLGCTVVVLTFFF